MNSLQIYTEKRTRTEWILLVGILLLAVYLRLGEPGVVEFKRDEANLSLLALDFADGGDVPLLGIGSSVGLPNAPVNVWLLAIPYMFSPDPQIATAFIAVLNVLSVVAVYWIGRRYGGPWVGLTAALLYAANPWAVIFSRKIWAQNMLPLFVLLTVASGFVGYLEGRRWGQIAHLPLLAITGQIHYGAFVIIPVTLTLLVAGRRLMQWRWFGLSVILAGLVTLPYLIGMNDAGLNTPAAIRAAINTAPENETSDVLLSDASLRGAAIIFSGVDSHSLAGPQQFQAYLDQVPDVYPLFYGVPLLLALSILWMLWLLLRGEIHGPKRWFYATLIAWIVFPIVIHTFNWTAFFIHYHIPAHAGGYLLIAFAAQSFTREIGFLKAGQRLIAAFFLIVCGFYILLWGQLLQFLDETYTPDGFGTPLHYLNDVKALVATQSNRLEVLIIVDVGGQRIGIDDEPTIWKALLFSEQSLQFEGHGTRIYPQNSAILLDRSCTGDGTVFPLRDGNETCYRVGTRSQDDLDLSEYTTLDDVPTRFANGAEIIGYRWQTESACVDLAWKVHDETDVNYSFAVQFLDADEMQVAAGDGPALLGENWRTGDTINQTFCGVPDERIVSVRLGMYTFDGVTFNNVELIDADGQPQGQSFIVDL